MMVHVLDICSADMSLDTPKRAPVGRIGQRGASGTIVVHPA